MRQPDWRDVMGQLIEEKCFMKIYMIYMVQLILIILVLLLWFMK